MAFITYKQADSRWGKKNYNGSSSMATAGCGPTSCAMIAYGVDGKTTPLDTMRYMQKHGYAVRNQGTDWNGIPACLKAFGVQNVQEAPDMAKCWELMKKGYVGVFLFISGKRGGVTWTTSGHFVAVTGYKYENGKHWVYVKDSYSNSSLRNGWITYEDNMRNDVVKVWSGKLAIKKTTAYTPKTAYTGKLPTKTLKRGDKGKQVQYLKDFFKWRFGWTFGNDVFGKGTEDCVKAFQKKYAKQYGLKVDGVFGPASLKVAKKIVEKYEKKYGPDPLQKWYDAMTTQYNWSKNQIYDFNTYPTVENSKEEGTCITFPAVSLQRIGLLPKGGYFYLYPSTGRIAGNSIGVNYVNSHPEIYSVSYPNKTIAQLGSGIKKGDIIGFTDPAYHTMVYMGKNANGEPIFNTMGHTKGLSITYPYYASRKVNMIVRLKKV